MNKIYCHDLYGIKNIGLEKWLDMHYVPLSGNDYIEIYEFVFQEYFRCFLDDKEDVYTYWFGVANIKVVRMVTTFIANQLLIKNLKNSNIKIVLTKRISGLDVFSPDINVQTYRKLSPTFSARNKIKGFLRQAVVAPSIFYSKRHYGCTVSKASNIVDKYFSDHALPMLFLDHRLFQKFSEDSIDGKLRFIIDDFFSKIITRFNFVNVDRYDEFVKRINRSLVFTNSLIASVMQWSDKSGCSAVYVAGQGNTFNRSFSAGCILSGTKVVSSVHGQPYATLRPNNTRLHHGELSISTELLMESRGLYVLYNKIQSQYKDKFILPNASRLYSDKNHSLFIEMQSEKKPNSVDRVMLIGYPYCGSYSSDCSVLNDFSMLRIEVDIIRALKKSGFYVIYKAHPDRRDEINNVFDGCVDEILVEPFEDCYNHADCLVFSSFATTTFGFSLMTNRPIVLVNTITDLYDESYDLIGRRCNIVQTYINGYGELTVNHNELASSVKNSLDNICYDVVHHYAF